MSPLEAMAKAHWANSEDTAWENLIPEDRAHMVGMMRSALLSLAEVELSEEVMAAGDMDVPGLDAHVAGAFRAMLRSIAEGS